jgi:hypothetical protein
MASVLLDPCSILMILLNLNHLFKDLSPIHIREGGLQRTDFGGGGIVQNIAFCNILENFQQNTTLTLKINNFPPPHFTLETAYV